MLTAEERREKACVRNAAYRAANRDKILARKSAYRAANREKLNAQRAAWSAANPDKIRAARATYRAANLDKLRAAKAAYYAANPDKVRATNAAYRAANPDKIRAKQAAYREANPDKIRVLKAKRRAIKRGATVEPVRTDIRAVLMWLQSGVCFHCDATIDSTAHLDHLQPLAVGGEHCEGNLALACPPCNLSRGARRIAQPGPLARAELG